MTPTLYLAFAFVFTITNRLYAKHTLNKIDTYAVTTLSQLLCAIVLLPIVWKDLTLLKTTDTSTVALIAGLGALWGLASWVGNASIAMNDFSFKEIIRQTRVLWVVLAGIFFLNEALTFHDTIGIACIIASVLIVSYKRVSFKEHISSRPILLAWFAGALIAFITILEKIVVGRVDVLLYAFFAYAIPTVLLAFFLNKSRIESIKDIFKYHKVQVCIFSLLMLGAYYTGLSAYKLLPISIAYPIIQSSTVFGVLIGTRLFEQNTHWKRKLFAATVAVVGVLIIQLF